LEVIGDKLVALPLELRRFVHRCHLEGQVPAHIRGGKEVVLQPRPEQPRLPYSPDLLPPAYNALAPVVIDKVAQRRDNLGLVLFQLFVVGAVIACSLWLRAWICFCAWSLELGV